MLVWARYPFDTWLQLWADDFSNATYNDEPCYCSSCLQDRTHNSFGPHFTLNSVFAVRSHRWQGSSLIRKSSISCLCAICKSQRSSSERTAISRKSFLRNNCLPSFNITCPFFGFLRALSIWAAFDCQRAADSNVVCANVALRWSSILR